MDRAPRTTNLKSEVLTIGYEGCRIDDFITRLQSAGVETLVDVRELPLSRKKGFSKNQLREAIEGVGIKYVHLKSLGDPKEGRRAARVGDHDRFVHIFTRHMETEGAMEGLQELSQIVGDAKTCLLCFERNHSTCHRKIVVDQLAVVSQITIRHIAV
jgi:uncharacterized protein (DUF488 family)